ncbi:hypothetical protein C7271_21745 [filamentous cyanobacterium CCP5]|nr:hypothetical protein C7271_21745 [filamentous cyanobacterium CCP5]
MPSKKPAKATFEAGEYMTIQDVLAAASQLSQEERLQVAIRLLESLRESYSIPRDKTALDPMLAWEGDVLVYQGKISPTFDLVAAVQAAREERSLE